MTAEHFQTFDWCEVEVFICSVHRTWHNWPPKAHNKYSEVTSRAIQSSHIYVTRSILVGITASLIYIFRRGGAIMVKEEEEDPASKVAYALEIKSHSESLHLVDSDREWFPTASYRILSADIEKVAQPPLFLFSVCYTIVWNWSRHCH